MLSYEDMWGINGYIMKRGGAIVLVSEENYNHLYPEYESYSSNLVRNMNSSAPDHNTYEVPLLFISISPGATDFGDITIRRGVSRLLETDASGLDPDDGDIFKLRLNSIIRERKKEGKTE